MPHPVTKSLGYVALALSLSLSVISYSKYFPFNLRLVDVTEPPLVMLVCPRRGHLGILSKDETSCWRSRGCDASPGSRADGGACRGLCERRPPRPPPVSSIVSRPANEQPPDGQSSPAAPCTPRTAVVETSNAQQKQKSLRASDSRRGRGGKRHSRRNRKR